jgi:hypothetical protein
MLRNVLVSALVAIALITVFTSDTPPRAAMQPCEPAPLRASGTVVLPATVPSEKRAVLGRMVAAANRLNRCPYRYDGGHRPYTAPTPGRLMLGHEPDGRLDAGYDGPGATSYVLAAGGLLPLPEGERVARPLRAAELRGLWEDERGGWLPGAGQWVTVVVCGDLAYLVVAGLRFDAHEYEPRVPDLGRTRPRGGTGSAAPIGPGRRGSHAAGQSRGRRGRGRGCGRSCGRLRARPVCGSVRVVAPAASGDQRRRKRKRGDVTDGVRLHEVRPA